MPRLVRYTEVGHFCRVDDLCSGACAPRITLTPSGPRSDKDSANVWWTEGGVHQNLTFPVQPDPVSGMHCWHQKVTVTKGKPDDRYGDIFVDTEKSGLAPKKWTPNSGPSGPARMMKRWACPARSTAASSRSRL